MFNNGVLPMKSELENLDQASCLTIEAFVGHCLGLNHQGIGDLFAEDIRFEGPLTGGELKGKTLVQSHFRQVFNRATHGGFIPETITADGRQVTIAWQPGHQIQGKEDQTRGQTIIDLDDEGLIKRVNVDWNPRLFLDLR